MENQIIETALENLRKNGILAEWEPENNLTQDGTLKIELPTNETLILHVEIKNELRMYQLEAVEDLAKKYPPLIIVANRLFPKIKKKLQEKNMAYLEANGNIFIMKKNLYILIDREKHLPKIKTEQNRAFTKTGLRVVFQLLADQEYINETYREMAARLGIGIANINYVFNGLRDTGYMVRLDNKKYKIQNTKELIDRWAAEYREKLKPGLLVGRFRFLDNNRVLNWKNLPMDYHKTCWGAEPAANILTGYLQPAVFTLYTEETKQEIIKKFRIVPDQNGYIMVYKKFWYGIGEGTKTVPPLLAYADLAFSNDSRLTETAQKIYNEYLQTNLGKA